MSSFEGLADHFDCENLDDGGSDSEHDSNNIRVPLLRWKVRIRLLISLSLFVKLKHVASSLQFNGSKKFYANFANILEFNVNNQFRLCLVWGILWRMENGGRKRWERFPLSILW